MRKKQTHRLGIILLLGILLYTPTVGAKDAITVGAFCNLLGAVDTANNLSQVTLSKEQVVTRKDAAYLLVTALGYNSVANTYKESGLLKDVAAADKGVCTLVAKWGIMQPMADGTFGPNQEVTVAQADVILGRVQQQITSEKDWRHAFYALSSSSQLDQIQHFDAVSFGWAQLQYDLLAGAYKLSATEPTNTFKVPLGYELAVDTAKANGVETYLMVYFENSKGSAAKLLSDTTVTKQLIQELVALCTDFTYQGVTRSFDGLTIDFEQFYAADLRVPYVTFLTDLRTALLAQGKKLQVAVQPATYYKGYDYKSIGEVADKVILMAHDYEAKSLTAAEQERGLWYTPITPINLVEKDLTALLDAATGIRDKSKVALQLSMASAQWQLKDNKVIHQKVYTPSYDKIAARLAQAGTTRAYDFASQNTYATYMDQGIKNIIWFEDLRSIKAKTNLARLLGVNSFSYWRLGTLLFI